MDPDTDNPSHRGATAAPPGPGPGPARSPGVPREQLLAEFDALLKPALFKDYGPNGLQVEGCATVSRLVSGVTASKALIEAAIAEGADAIFVHHGLFWRGQTGCVTGWMKQRLALLLQHGINLYAYHLPLDAHAELGNNVQLGLRLGFASDLAEASGWARFGDQNLGCLADVPPCSTEALAQRAEQALGRSPTVVAAAARSLRRVAWCTGGAQGYFEDAIAAGADAYITGEISEPQAHYAREMGVSYLACGHHATERYGAPAVAGHVAARLGLAHTFIDIDNPA
jgi:dinuclear metal center YbgI/SA1388 family protein